MKSIEKELEKMEKKARRKAEKNADTHSVNSENKKIVKAKKHVDFAGVTSALFTLGSVALVISLLAHFFTGNVSTKGVGYCGIIVAKLGKFFGGFLTFFCGGFSLIGAIIGAISLAVDNSVIDLSLVVLADAIIICDIVFYIMSVVKVV